MIGLKKQKLPKKIIVLYLARNLENKSKGRELTKSINDNIVSLINLLLLIQNKTERFIFLSSISVYGKPKKLPITEKNEISPISNYGIQKACCEIILESFCKHHKIPLTIIRLSQVYGITSAKHSLPQILVKNLQNSKKVPIKSGLKIKRDYIHIDDLLKFLNSVLKSKNNGVYNFGYDKGVSVRELFKTAYKVYGLEFNYVSNSNPSFSQFFNIDKALKTFGYSPSINVKSWIKYSKKDERN